MAWSGAIRLMAASNFETVSVALGSVLTIALSRGWAVAVLGTVRTDGLTICSGQILARAAGLALHALTRGLDATGKNDAAYRPVPHADSVHVASVAVHVI